VLVVERRHIVMKFASENTIALSTEMLANRLPNLAKSYQQLCRILRRTELSSGNENKLAQTKSMGNAHDVSL